LWPLRIEEIPIRHFLFQCLALQASTSGFVPDLKTGKYPPSWVTAYVLGPEVEEGLSNKRDSSVEARAYHVAMSLLPIRAGGMGKPAGCRKCPWAIDVRQARDTGAVQVHRSGAAPQRERRTDRRAGCLTNGLLRPVQDAGIAFASS
jgi:hypothetical protein